MDLVPSILEEYSLRKLTVHCDMLFVVFTFVLVLQSEVFALRNILSGRCHVKRLILAPLNCYPLGNKHNIRNTCVSKTKRHMRKIVPIIATLSLSLKSGVSFARYKQSSKSNDEASILFSGFSDSRILAADMVAKDGVVIDVEVDFDSKNEFEDIDGGSDIEDNYSGIDIDKKDFTTAAEQGIAFNRIGLISIVLILAKFCIEGLGDIRKKERYELKRAESTKLNLLKDNLSEIMCKLDSTLEERRKKVGRDGSNFCR